MTELRVTNLVEQYSNIQWHNEDYVLEKQWQDYKNLAMAWGTSNRNANGEYLNMGKSGEAIDNKLVAVWLIAA